MKSCTVTSPLSCCQQGVITLLWKANRDELCSKEGEAWTEKSIAASVVALQLSNAVTKFIEPSRSSPWQGLTVLCIFYWHWIFILWRQHLETNQERLPLWGKTVLEFSHQLGISSRGPRSVFHSFVNFVPSSAICLYLCLPRFGVKISCSPTTLWEKMRYRPQRPVTTAAGAQETAGCNKSRWEPRPGSSHTKIRCIPSLRHTREGITGKQVAKCCWETGTIWALLHWCSEEVLMTLGYRKVVKMGQNWGELGKQG